MRHSISSLCLRCALGVFAMLLPALPRAQAAPPMGAMRNDARMVQRTIQKNIEVIIHPKLFVAPEQKCPVASLALSPAEDMLLVGAGSGDLRVWDLARGAETAILRGQGAALGQLAVSQTANLAAAADADGNVVVWDLEKSQAVRRHAAPLGPLAGLAFSPDGASLAAFGAKGRMARLDLGSAGVAGMGEAQPGGIAAVARVPEGWVLAPRGQEGVRLLSPADGRVLAEWGTSGHRIALLAGSAQGNVLAGAGEDGAVVLWDARTGALLGEDASHSGRVQSLAVNEQAGIVAAGYADGAVFLHAVADLRRARRLDLGRDGLSALVLGREGDFLLAASPAGVVSLWSTVSGQRLVDLLPMRDGWAAVDAQGRFDGSLGALPGIEWRDGDIQLPVNNFTQQYYEPALVMRTMKNALEPAAAPAISDGIHLPPTVQVKPEEEVSREGSVVMQVKAVENGMGGVEGVNLYQNGKLLGGNAVLDQNREADDAGRATVTKRYKVRLGPGQNTLSAVATNGEKLESVPASISLDRAGTPPPPSVHVLAVGIDKYALTDLVLNCAVQDAGAVDAFFAKGAGVPYGVRLSHSIFDREATRQGVLDAMQGLLDSAPSDIVVMYFAGHGVTVGNAWYFLPQDVADVDDADIPRESVSSDEIKRYLEAIPAEKVFLALDTCQSGAAVKSMSEFSGIKILRLLSRSVGVHVLSATKRDQYAIEAQNLGHGVFTYVLLKGLSGEADSPPQDHVVTVLEIMRYIEEQVSMISRQFNYLQTPTAHSRGVNFILSVP